MLRKDIIYSTSLIMKLAKKNFFWFVALFLLVSGLGVFFFAQPGQSRIRAYSHGKAAYYNGQVVIVTTNMSYAEFFVLENGYLRRTAVIQPQPDRWSRELNFFDADFNVENGRLYAYTAEGRYFSKYDVSNPDNPILVKSVKDNSWDWFTGVEIFGRYVATVSNKWTKIYNYDLMVIDAYEVKSPHPDNVKFSPNGDQIFQIADGQLKIYNRRDRQVTAARDFLLEDYQKNAIYNDSLNGALYLVDNEGLKKLSLDGRIDKIFYHTSNLGYDAAGTAGSPYVYFSDGIGVVKMNKNTMEPVAWEYTTTAPLDNGWAAGLEAVMTDQGEIIVLFNSSCLAVYDGNLRLLDYFASSEEDLRPAEGLFLKTDKNRSAAGGQIFLRGGGFGIREPLTIKFESSITKIYSDEQGRFNEIITVPVVEKPLATEIKVSGADSRLHYSLGFFIE